MSMWVYTDLTVRLLEAVVDSFVTFAKQSAVNNNKTERLTYRLTSNNSYDSWWLSPPFLSR